MRRHFYHHTIKFYFKKYWLRASLAVAISAASFTLVNNAPKYHEQYIRWRLRSAVVHIVNTIGGQPFNSGTGFYVQSGIDGIAIITNFHVCEPISDEQRAQYKIPASWEFSTWVEETESKMEILKKNPDSDLCLLGFKKAPKQKGYPLSVVDNDPDLGDMVYTGGYPGTRGFTIREGRIIQNTPIPRMRPECAPLGFFGFMNPDCFEAIDTTIVTFLVEPGASGSPVVDWRGRLVGVVWGMMQSTGGNGLLVPAYKVREFLK